MEIGKSYTWSELVAMKYTHIKSDPAREYWYGHGHWLVAYYCNGKYLIKSSHISD